jgi:hypothetical protein
MYYILIFISSFFLCSQTISTRNETEEKEKIALEKLIERFCSYSIYKKDEICKNFSKEKKENSPTILPLPPPHP